MTVHDPRFRPRTLEAAVDLHGRRRESRQAAGAACDRQQRRWGARRRWRRRHRPVPADLGAALARGRCGAERRGREARGRAAARGRRAGRGGAGRRGARDFAGAGGPARPQGRRGARGPDPARGARCAGRAVLALGAAPLARTSAPVRRLVSRVSLAQAPRADRLVAAPLPPVSPARPRPARPAQMSWRTLRQATRRLCSRASASAAGPWRAPCACTPPPRASTSSTRSSTWAREARAGGTGAMFHTVWGKARASRVVRCGTFPTRKRGQPPAAGSCRRRRARCWTRSRLRSWKRRMLWWQMLCARPASSSPTCRRCCVFTHACAHTHARAYTHILLQTHIRPAGGAVYTCTRARTRARARTQPHTHTLTHTRIHIGQLTHRLCVCVCMHLCVCVCMCVCVCVQMQEHLQQVLEELEHGASPVAERLREKVCVCV